MKKTIAVLKGDGIGPEIVGEAVKVLQAVAASFGHDFALDERLVGGAAYEAVGDCLPAATLAACRAADAVLLGAVGGPRWDALPGPQRPEPRALLTLRKELGLFANLRPAKVWAPLTDASPLKPAIVGDGIDLLVVRELTGGVYFGAHSRAADGRSAFDVMPYSVAEIERIARTAFACEKNGAEGYSGDVIEEKTVNACNSFFDALPGIAEYIRSDIKAAFDGDPAADNYEIIMTAYPGIKAIFAYRVAHALLLVGVPFVPRIMTECAHSETGIDIHPGATIGKSFFIDHGTGVVIGETAIIGERVKLYQGVTIGAKTLADARTLVGVKRHPTIEDDVTVYSGATILGGDTIVGKGAVIGSSAFVLQSVPAGAKVSAAKPTTA